jgi:hypothetical protein
MIFRGVILGILKKIIFQNYLSGKFPNFFGVKFSAKFSLEFSEENIYKKWTPGLKATWHSFTYMLTTLDILFPPRPHPAINLYSSVYGIKVGKRQKRRSD